MSDERLAPLYERNIRRAAQGEQLYDLPASLQPLLAEFDRLLAVEKAAAALGDVIENKLWHIDGKLVGPLDTLKDALNGGKT